MKFEQFPNAAEDKNTEVPSSKPEVVSAETKPKTGNVVDIGVAREKLAHSPEGETEQSHNKEQAATRFASLLDSDIRYVQGLAERALKIPDIQDAKALQEGVEMWMDQVRVYRENMLAELATASPARTAEIMNDLGDFEQDMMRNFSGTENTIRQHERTKGDSVVISQEATSRGQANVRESVQDRGDQETQERKETTIVEDLKVKLQKIKNFEPTGNIASDCNVLIELTGRSRLYEKVDPGQEPVLVLAGLSGMRTAWQEILKNPDSVDVADEAKRLFYVDVPRAEIEALNKLINFYSDKLSSKKQDSSVTGSFEHRSK